jgi:erythromycin esterase-like protein
VRSLDALDRAVAEFAVTDPGLLIEPPARAAARRSLDSAGLLLLGEVHGVRENPLLIRELMQAFGLTSLALEWPEDLAPAIQAFLAGQALADHWFVWGGDGRITAGHLAVLAERAAAGPLELILFDGVIGAGWSWSQRDEAMARRLLAASGPGVRTLAVAGNAHTPTSPTELGVPMGLVAASAGQNLLDPAIASFLSGFEAALLLAGVILASAGVVGIRGLRHLQMLGSSHPR